MISLGNIKLKQDFDLIYNNIIKIYSFVESVLSIISEIDINKKNSYIIKDMIDDLIEIEISVSGYLEKPKVDSNYHQFSLINNIDETMFELINKTELMISKAQLIK
jgi:hypothetical protein